MNIAIPEEKSLGQLLYDLGFKYLCDGRKNFNVKALDLKIINSHLSKKKDLDFPIYANRQNSKGRNFLTNPGVFLPPNSYYFFKEARYRPDKNTFVVIVSAVKILAEGIKPDIGHEKEMLVGKIRLSIDALSGGAFERRYRTVDSVSRSYMICK